MSDETKTAEITTEMTAREKRAAARAAKVEAKATALAARTELIAEAADALASHRAGVEDAKLTGVMELALKAAAQTVEGVKACQLLKQAGVKSVTGVVDLPSDQSRSAQRSGAYWTRQNNDFLREHDDLQPGSFATGRSGYPRDTAHGYCFLRAETRREQVLVAIAWTKAEQAGAVAQAAVETVWTEVEAAADALEAAETE